jgi:hypothetical protein
LVRSLAGTIACPDNAGTGERNRLARPVIATADHATLMKTDRMDVAHWNTGRHDCDLIRIAVSADISFSRASR